MQAEFTEVSGPRGRRESHVSRQGQGATRVCSHAMLERRAVAPFRALGLVHPPRREFILLTRLETIFENGSSVENIALLIARVREDKRLVNALPRFAL